MPIAVALAVIDGVTRNNANIATKRPSLWYIDICQSSRFSASGSSYHTKMGFLDAACGRRVCYRRGGGARRSPKRGGRGNVGAEWNLARAALVSDDFARC